MTDDDDEILALVDANDKIIGSMRRGEVYEKHLKNIRVVNCFIVNSEGKLWVPRRTKHKKLFPGALDLSIGGHVSYGETYELAIIKEAREEANIDLTKIPFAEIGYFKAGEHGLHCFQKIYQVTLDDAPAYNPSDFSEYYWLTPKELIDKIEKDKDPAKGDLPVLVKILYL